MILSEKQEHTTHTVAAETFRTLRCPHCRILEVLLVLTASIMAASGTFLPDTSGRRVISLAIVGDSELDKATFVLFGVAFNEGTVEAVMQSLLVLLSAGVLMSDARISASMPSKSSSDGAGGATVLCCCLPFARFFDILYQKVLSVKEYI
jgi:hypothetical protein